MVKLSKFYIMVMCTAALLAGCGQTQETMQEEAPVTETIEQTEEAEQEQEPSEVIEEEVLHPVTEDGIDYLSVDGIVLEPGVEIAMVATNSDNPYWDTVKDGASQAVADLNEAFEYSGK